MSDVVRTFGTKASGEEQPDELTIPFGGAQPNGLTIPRKPIDDVPRDGFSLFRSKVDADRRDA